MTITLNTDRLLECAIRINKLHEILSPDDPSSNSGFYLMNPHTLYVDEAIDNEIVGELDKTLCNLIGGHDILEKWEEYRYPRK